ncbi:MAG: hypothetical protein U9R19_07490 [Bacteroidota bacterium]|nr:hypothetical protein [Bacteroidota bacterium]
MNSHKNILLVGGTGRNTGKTSLVCEVIKKFSTDYQIIALKITNHFHSANSKSFNLLEEKNPAANKDSSRMLLAGASKVFYIESGPDCLKEAFDTFLEKTVPGQIIVCESNGLSEIIKPGIYLMVDRNGNFEKKKKTSDPQIIA